MEECGSEGLKELLYKETEGYLKVSVKFGIFESKKIEFDIWRQWLIYLFSR